MSGAARATSPGSSPRAGSPRAGHTRGRTGRTGSPRAGATRSNGPPPELVVQCFCRCALARIEVARRRAYQGNSTRSYLMQLAGAGYRIDLPANLRFLTRRGVSNVAIAKALASSGYAADAVAACLETLPAPPPMRWATAAGGAGGEFDVSSPYQPHSVGAITAAIKCQFYIRRSIARRRKYRREVWARSAGSGAAVGPPRKGLLPDFSRAFGGGAGDADDDDAVDAEPTLLERAAAFFGDVGVAAMGITAPATMGHLVSVEEVDPAVVVAALQTAGVPLEDVARVAALMSTDGLPAAFELEVAVEAALQVKREELRRVEVLEMLAPPGRGSDPGAMMDVTMASGARHAVMVPMGVEANTRLVVILMTMPSNARANMTLRVRKLPAAADDPSNTPRWADVIVPYGGLPGTKVAVAVRAEDVYAAGSGPPDPEAPYVGPPGLPEEQLPSAMLLAQGDAQLRKAEPVLAMQLDRGYLNDIDALCSAHLSHERNQEAFEARRGAVTTERDAVLSEFHAKCKAGALAAARTFRVRMQPKPTVYDVAFDAGETELGVERGSIEYSSERMAELRALGIAKPPEELAVGEKVQVRSILKEARGHPAGLHWSARITATHVSGMNVDTCDSEGRSAMHAAAEGGHAKLAQWLMERGCEPDRRSLRGNTPLHLACWQGALDLVRVLLEEGGADVDCVNADGETPLAFACACGHDHVAFALLDEYGADVNKVGAFGMSPVTYRAARALSLWRAQLAEPIRALEGWGTMAADDGMIGLWNEGTRGPDAGGQRKGVRANRGRERNFAGASIYRGAPV